MAYRTFYFKDIVRFVTVLLVVAVSIMWFISHTPCQRMIFKKAAQFFYDHGMTGLDGDGDNRPCEQL